MKKIIRYLIVMFAVFSLLGLSACKPKPKPVPSPSPTPAETVSPTAEPTTEPTAEPTPEPTEEPVSAHVSEDGEYDTKDEVAEYIWLYHHLPSNYMTKKEARKQGWEGGPLHLVIKGKCIGGDSWSNRQGSLPKKKGLKYYECDIDTLHSKSRGAKRIVYSSEWAVYYTEDHYDSFELLYGEEP